MRVQLSPWEVAQTTFQHPSTRRRAGSSAAQQRPQITACFVEHTSSSLRSRKKRKTSKKGHVAVGEDRMPMLTITSSHRVAVLVENYTPQQKKNEEMDKEDPIQNCFVESSFLQLNSRPGKATAFFPEINGGGLRVPAVFDAQRNRIYALQKNNTKLICYATMKGSGSENDISSSSSVDLDTPALSLSLLHLPRISSKTAPRCLVYGTCQDGRIFVACLNSDKDPCLLVDYFDTDPQSSKDHVGTIAYLVAAVEHDTMQGKRKTDLGSSAGECEVVIHQVFRQVHGVSILRQGIQIAPYVTKGVGWASVVASGFQEGPNENAITLSKGASITDVCMLGLIDESATMSLFYTDSDGQSFYTSALLRTGGTIHAPTLLPTDSLQAGLIGPALLAVLTKRGVFVYDTIRGVRIHNQALPLSFEEDASLTLVSDAKRSRMAVLSAYKDKYVIALTTVYAEDATTAQPLLSGTRLSLAAGLASSLASRNKVSVRPTMSVAWENAHPDDSYPGLAPTTVESGVELLENAFEKVENRAQEVTGDLFLRNAFKEAVKEALKKARSDSDDNPQDAIPTENGGRVNGVYSPARKAKEDILGNGHHRSPPSDPFQHLDLLPQSFIDAAASVVVDILCMASTSELGGTISADARFLLQRLVFSGKLSARSHLVPKIDHHKMTFSNLLRSLESKASDESRGMLSTYTPFDLARQLCENCSDVSEHQMVAIIHYMLSRANPKDVAASFIRNEALKEDEPILAKVTRFSLLETKRNLNVDEENEMSVLGRKLVVFGLAATVKSMIKYSSCNDSLLRDALLSLLSEVELRFFAKFLFEMLYSPEKFCVIPGPGVLRNSIQWLSALCDCLQQVSPSCEEIKNFRRSVATQLWVTGKISSLQSALEDNLSGTPNLQKAGDAMIKSEKHSRNLPRYQIERLVF